MFFECPKIYFPLVQISHCQLKVTEVGEQTRIRYAMQSIYIVLTENHRKISQSWGYVHTKLVIESSWVKLWL